MKNVVIIFGGDSVEHDISILTGLHAARHVIDSAAVHLVYLARNGQMVTSNVWGGLLKIESYINNTAEKAAKCFFSDGCLYRVRKFLGVKKVCKVDAVLNCCHGGVGEGGQLAGMLETVGVPVTSCNYYSAAVLQSKSLTRGVLSDNKFIQPEYFKVGKDAARNFNAVEFPVIVKPDTLGSSIGIAVAHNAEELCNALDAVFLLDKVAIVERFLETTFEINCAAFRYNGQIRTSRCEIVERKKEIFDFDAKYLDAGSGFIKKKNDEDAEEVVPFSTEIQALTQEVYELFGCRGVVRADFLVVGSDIYLNEINTVPGFLSYHLWQKSGLPYGVLIDMLVRQARVDAESGTKTAFSSEILQKNRNLVEN